MSDRKKKISKTKIWIGWSIASMFFFYQFLIRVMPNVIAPELMSSLNMTASDFGMFMAVYYVSYTASHIPIGVLIDYFGPRILITISSLVCAICIIPLASNSTPYWLAVTSRILIGAASSVGVLGAIKTVMIYFPQNKFGTFFGFSATFALLGAAYGGQPLNIMFSNLGIEKSILILASFGFSIAFLAFAFCPSDKSQSEYNFLENVKKVLKNRTWLYISIIGGIMVAPMEGFADAWSTLFLTTNHGLSQSNAGFASSLIFIGMAIGTPFMGQIVDRFFKYSYVALNLISLGMLLCFVALLLFAQIQIYGIVLIMFCIGFCLSYQIIVIGKSCSFFTPDLSAFVGASSNMIIMIFGFFYHMFIGKAIDNSWDGSFDQSGNILFSSKDLESGIVIIPIMLAISCLLILLMQFSNRTKKS